MHIHTKIPALIFGGLFLTSLVAISWFDIKYVGPAASKARSILAQASTTERQPPIELARLIAASDGGKEKANVLVRRLLQTEPAQIDDLRTTHRQLIEFGTTVLIGWHLEESEITSARLASSYLGASIVGFERGASAYFNAPLEHLSRDQLAELVALERTPTASPEKIRRIKQLLLERTA